MKLINNSPYDTMALRRILCQTHRAVAKRESWGLGHSHWWKRLRVTVDATRPGTSFGFTDERGQFASASSVSHVSPSGGRVRMLLPKLQGVEFVGLLRQQHGGSSSTSSSVGGLTSEAVALLWQTAEYTAAGVSSGGQWWRRVLLDYSLKKLPEFVALRVLKPAKPRDRLKDKHAHAHKMIKQWTRKLKLANTKLKLYNQKLRRAAKLLASRKEATQ